VTEPAVKASLRRTRRLCQNPLIGALGALELCFSEQQTPQVMVFCKSSENKGAFGAAFWGAPKPGLPPGCATPDLTGRIDSKYFPTLFPLRTMSSSQRALTHVPPHEDHALWIPSSGGVGIIKMWDRNHHVGKIKLLLTSWGSSLEAHSVSGHRVPRGRPQEFTMYASVSFVVQVLPLTSGRM
jgi:hypothetical protein